jgi:hypothetical protein
MLGESPTLYPLGAVTAPTPIRPLAESLVADLIVAAGRHPAAARHLAESSGQPATVVSLVEERLRRSSLQMFSERSGGSAERGLRLIDNWRDAGPRGPSVADAAPEPPEPPAA